MRHGANYVKAARSGRTELARRKIDEDVPVPLSTSDCVEWIVSLTKALHFFHVRSVGQRAIKLVGPGVILALNPSSELAFFLLAEHGAAMAADVVECADSA